MPLQATSGAASYDAFGGGVPVEPNYIESVFSCFLYTGNGSTQTINNGIDLAGKGGLVWWKKRSGVSENDVRDTIRGVGQRLITNRTDASASIGGVSSFNNNGFTVTGINDSTNATGDTYVSWTFREQAKFFDVVTFTSPASGSLTVNHNLGSAPGCILLKRTNGIGDWLVYHRSTGSGKYLLLNATDAVASFGAIWANVTSTSFQVSVGVEVNANDTYVAYLFAHNAGGFGLSGTDNVISCGSFTADGSGNATINLGYEPQWVMVKRTDSTSNWFMVDSMRGNPTLISGTSNEQILRANTSDAETSSWGFANPTSTGFVAASSGASSTWIYIAIRRGPMKTPTTGTSVFTSVARTGTGSATTIGSTGFPVDSIMYTLRSGGLGTSWQDRLRGSSAWFQTFDTAAESTVTTQVTSFANQDSVNIGAGSYINANGSTYINYAMRRAPGFFDEVCYTTGAGTGQTTFNHNLGVTPELVISKTRSAIDDWYVYAQPLGTSKTLYLNANLAEQGFTCTDSLSSTQARTYLGVGSATAVSYLFASCPGVSKVFNYTGNGSSQTINCGFTGGARFVMIKRTDSTGNWMVVDTARGLVSAGDPTLYLNSTAAEVTGVDWIDPDSSGFIVNQEGTMNANVNGATYIGLAVA